MNKANLKPIIRTIKFYFFVFFFIIGLPLFSLSTHYFFVTLPNDIEQFNIRLEKCTNLEDTEKEACIEDIDQALPNITDGQKGFVAGMIFLFSGFIGFLFMLPMIIFLLIRLWKYKIKNSP